MSKYELIAQATLQRNSSSKPSCEIIPETYVSLSHGEELGHATSATRGVKRSGSIFSHFLRSLLSVFTFSSFLPSRRWLTIPSQPSIVIPSIGRKVTGTLFGNRRGHVSFAVQIEPGSEPVFLIQLGVSTANLVKEMSSGLVRIALECEKPAPTRRMAAARLLGEPVWTMYLNGRRCGYAKSRECSGLDWHVLSTLQRVSIGAGVIPVVDDGRDGGVCEGELLYMRARFERVVGSRDSEAFYMMNPDGNGGPELCIFFIRI